MYLPFIITTDPDVVISGRIPFEPVVSENGRKLMLEELPKDVSQLQMGMMLENKAIYNPGDLWSSMLLMGTVQYARGEFRIEKRWLDGACADSYAVVIVRPQDFMERITSCNNSLYPNLKRVEAAEVIYDDELIDTNRKDCIINPFVRPEKEAWKKEVAIVSRCKDDVILFQGEKLMQPGFWEIGAIGDIAVRVSLQDLVEGRMPQEIYDAIEMAGVEQEGEEESGFPYITDAVYSFSCNIQDIRPEKKYIEIFQTVLSPDEWIQMTEMVNTATFNVQTPILVFRKTNGGAMVRFFVNTVECYIQSNASGVVDSAFIKPLLQMIKDKFGDRFTHLVLAQTFCMGKLEKNGKGRKPMEEVERSRSTEKTEYADYLMLDERKSVRKNGLIHDYHLTKDRLVKPNMFGFSSASDEFWQFQMKIVDDETILWYKAGDVTQFFIKAGQEIEKTARLLSDGDIVKCYREL